MEEIRIHIRKKDIDKCDPAKARAMTPLDRAVARDYPDYYMRTGNGTVRLQVKTDEQHIQLCYRGYNWDRRDTDLVFPYDEALTKFINAWWRGANVMPLTTTLRLNTYVTMVAEAGNGPLVKDDGTRI